MSIRTSILVALTLGITLAIGVALGTTLYSAVDGSSGLSPLHEPTATISLY